MVDRRLSLLPVLALLAGCSAEPIVVGQSYVGSFPITQNPSGVPLSIKVNVGPGRALAALPPEAGPVLAVNETRHANGIAQEIILGGPHAVAGQNIVSVIELTPPDPAWRGSQDGNLKIASINDTAIEADLERLFPRIAMKLTATFQSNAQGPFSFATGKSGAATCLYAWQNITPARPVTLLEGASGLGDYPISVRVRLCRNAGEAALVDLVRRMSVVRPGAGPAYAPSAGFAAPMAGADALTAAGVGAPAYASAGSYGTPAVASGYGASSAYGAPVVMVPAPVVSTPFVGAPTITAAPYYAPAPAIYATADPAGTVVVPGPVTTTPFGVVASVPALSGGNALGPAPVYAPYGTALPNYTAPLATPPTGPTRVATTRTRVRHYARRDPGIINPGRIERITGPIVPLPSDLVAAPVPSSLAPRPAAQVQAPARGPVATDDALPMPK